jgi:hypothetical protein
MTPNALAASTNTIDRRIINESYVDGREQSTCAPESVKSKTR